MIKIAVPNMACQVIDWAIQVFGGGGTSNDFGLAAAYATARLLRLADGPDEVHRDQLARMEFTRQSGRNDGAGIGNWAPALSDRALGE
jgi:acyl-CoA dehydrogenase